MKNESNGHESTLESGENETRTRFESTTETEERWLPIPGFEGHYEVSDLGRVCSLKADSRRVLKPLLNFYGYSVVDLSLQGVKCQRHVHALVLMAFVGPRPLGFQGCHNDGVRDNNCLSNLRWDTPAGNNLDRVAHGSLPVGVRHGLSKLNDDLVREIRAEMRAGASGPKVAAKYGVAVSQVYNIVNRRTWRHVD